MASKIAFTGQTHWFFTFPPIHVVLLAWNHVFLPSPGPNRAAAVSPTAAPASGLSLAKGCFIVFFPRRQLSGQLALPMTTNIAGVLLFAGHWAKDLQNVRHGQLQ